MFSLKSPSSWHLSLCLRSLEPSSLSTVFHWNWQQSTESFISLETQARHTKVLSVLEAELLGTQPTSLEPKTSSFYQVAMLWWGLMARALWVLFSLLPYWPPVCKSNGAEATAESFVQGCEHKWRQPSGRLLLVKQLNFILEYKE